jgi:hypothetical protein
LYDAFRFRQPYEQIPDAPGPRPVLWKVCASAKTNECAKRRASPGGIAKASSWLEDVLINASGAQKLAGDRRLAAYKSNAGSFVRAFSYRDQMSGKPVRDEQGTRDRLSFAASHSTKPSDAVSAARLRFCQITAIRAADVDRNFDRWGTADISKSNGR